MSRPSADDCLTELIVLACDSGCISCPLYLPAMYEGDECTLPDDGKRPCQVGWRTWLERRVQEQRTL